MPSGSDGHLLFILATESTDKRPEERGFSFGRVIIMDRAIEVHVSVVPGWSIIIAGRFLQ